MDKVKEEIIDCATGEKTYKYYTDEEWAQVLKETSEAESKKPISYSERIELLENALLEIAEIQSTEYENRIILENAIIELANLVGGEEMGELYVKRIKEAKMTIDQVPALWRDKVQAELNK